ncbi:MAG: RNA recognition motif domain-containing protein, partial [Candidatus Binataceae bacterium]
MILPMTLAACEVVGISAAMKRPHSAQGHFAADYIQQVSLEYSSACASSATCRTSASGPMRSSQGNALGLLLEAKGSDAMFGWSGSAIRRRPCPAQPVLEESLMGRRLYVGNLAWTVTDQDLHDAFAEVGGVENSQVIIDRATNRSRGFGFVEMATDVAAEEAIKKLNGRDI